MLGQSTSVAGKYDVVVVIAHPDDEVFASGTLCLLSEKGFKIALVCVTDGEGGSRELLQQVDPASSLGELRRRELALSIWALGVHEVAFLGHADIPPDAWGKSRAWDQASLISTLASIIQRADPTLILTHGPLGGYGHPAHREVHRCVMAAARKVSYGGSVFFFAGQVKDAFFSWRFDQPSDVLVDARGFLRRRVASLCYHQSQSEFFLGPYFPGTVRKMLSALYGGVFAFTESGRKRLPIITPSCFFRRFPVEGLVRQAEPPGQPNFFAEHFRNDSRVRFID
ncbi:MAG: PIG-L deacetylase family protein [Candidatus Binataceae bacterium]